MLSSIVVLVDICHLDLFCHLFCYISYWVFFVWRSFWFLWFLLVWVVYVVIMVLWAGGIHYFPLWLWAVYILILCSVLHLIFCDGFGCFKSAYFVSSASSILFSVIICRFVPNYMRLPLFLFMSDMFDGFILFCFSYTS